MPLELFDSHTHLDSKEYDSDRDEVIARARAAGVTRIVTIGIGHRVNGFLSAVEVAEKNEGVWCSIGTHPHDAALPIDIAALREYTTHPKVVAIGETGLDYFRDWAPRDLQEKWFRAQIELALEVKKPLIIHSREAGEDCLRILTEMGAGAVGGVFHCYAENAAFAERLRSINFMVSFPGSATFKKAQPTRDAVAQIPLEQIMIETDAPYLAPEPHRGERCESALMVETAKVLAKVKNMTLEAFAAATTENAKRFFKVP